ncbi:MAG: hypothetical protein PHH04_02695 [Thomasclavelia sp.]|jgi:hypothetical protein|nr:hypothetical protein [Thomasclavelia sp.]
MSIHENLVDIEKSITKLNRSGKYDGEKLSASLKHLTSQLEFFYCHLLSETKEDHETYYSIPLKPKEHQLAYFNIGRGFPKELMDGHYCYILKDLGYKSVVIPCTSIKNNDKPHKGYEMDINIKINGQNNKSRLQFTDIRTVDNQRLDLRKSFWEVTTSRSKILNEVKKILF